MTKRDSRRGRDAAVGAGVGLACGAALAYWLDPRSGRRRRARVRDRAVHAAHELTDALDKGTRDLAHRARGVVAETAARLGEHHVDDETLARRVRAELGRVCAHPHAVDVVACQGVVELRGPVLKRERKRLLAAIARVRGVHAVRDQLEPHRRADVARLQGGVPPRASPMQERWSPGPRLVAGGLALGLVASGLRRRDGFGRGLVVAGALVLARAAANLPLRRLVGLARGRGVIEVAKELHIDVPLDDAYAFFAAFENFPRFMTHVRQVRHLGGDRWHWEVQGPAGVTFAWDAEVHERLPGARLAWRSLPGAAVASAGAVFFAPDARGGTRLGVRLVYNPPGGALGHGFARLFGADPKREMDDDLLRLKSLLEAGKARGRQGRVTRDEVTPPPPPDETVH